MKELRDKFDYDNAGVNKLQLQNVEEVCLYLSNLIHNLFNAKLLGDIVVFKDKSKFKISIK